MPQHLGWWSVCMVILNTPIRRPYSCSPIIGGNQHARSHKIQIGITNAICWLFSQMNIGPSHIMCIHTMFLADGLSTCPQVNQPTWDVSLIYWEWIFHCCWKQEMNRTELKKGLAWSLMSECLASHNPPALTVEFHKLPGLLSLPILPSCARMLIPK